MEPKYDKHLVCKHCHGSICFHQIRLARINGRDVWSYYYTCLSCAFSSPGRQTLREAEADAVIIPLEQHQ